MQTLLFEMTPRDGHEEHYFAHVDALRPVLLKQTGLVFVQRYKSLSRPQLILSHSLWQDEASIVRWRSNKAHHKSQVAGRYKHFSDYRIRVSQALYGHTEPDDQKYLHSDTVYSEFIDTTDRYVTIVRSTNLLENHNGEHFQSVSETDSYLSVADYVDLEAAYTQCVAAQSEKNVLSAILARTSRDYGLNDRDEAPQHI